MNKLTVLQGFLYTLIGALMPVSTALTGSVPLTMRNVFAIAIGSLVGGATALKAFLSTTFADNQQNNEHPKTTQN